MTFPSPEIESVTVVLAGAFNPTILQPAWFAAEKLLRKGETDEAQNVVISKEYTSFSLEWLTLQARNNRLDFYSEDAGSFDLLRDLVMGTFRLLSHTPVESASLVYHSHSRAESEEVWHRVGDALAPKSFYADLLKQPGLLHLQLQAKRPDERIGEVVVWIEPSHRVKPGVYFAVSDGFDLRDEVTDPKGLAGAGKLMDILTTDWSSSINRGRQTVTSILERI